jgi:hypothetical protein
MGYYKKYTRYEGWIYKDIKGTLYVGWFNSVGQGAVVGPDKVVNKISYNTCGM